MVLIRHLLIRIHLTFLFVRKNFVSTEDVVAQQVGDLFLFLLCLSFYVLPLLSCFFLQIVVQKGSPKGVHFRRSGPREKVYFLLSHAQECFWNHGNLNFLALWYQVYFKSEEVRACIVTCGGLCPGINTVIREIVCGLNYMYGVHDILGIEVGYLWNLFPSLLFLKWYFSHWISFFIGL